MKLLSKYEAPWASPDELYCLDTGAWRYQRPKFKGDKCCHCGTCYIFCPVGCVRERGSQITVDLEYCKGCGICARLCPVNAIIMIRET